MKNYSKEQIFNTVEVSFLNGNCGEYHISWMYGKKTYEAQGEFELVAATLVEDFYCHEFISPRGKVFNIYFSINGCVTVSQVFRSDDKLGFSTEIFVASDGYHRLSVSRKRTFFVPFKDLSLSIKDFV